jgi:antitoxin ParD1/3/4
MARNTSILLGDHFEVFIDNQVKTGRYNSASEVVRAALRLFDMEETKKAALIKALEKGENSGFTTDLDSEQLLRSLHDKYLTR